MADRLELKEISKIFHWVYMLFLDIKFYERVKQVKKSMHSMDALKSKLNRYVPRNVHEEVYYVCIQSVLKYGSCG